MSDVFLFLFLGLSAGAASGLLGVGGGIIIVPTLVFLLGFSERLAQGTTLALMLPPIGILAVWEYWKHGFVNWPAALFICLGFVLGGFLGSKVAVNLSDGYLQKIFGAAIVLMGLYMIIKN